MSKNPFRKENRGSGIVEGVGCSFVLIFVSFLSIALGFLVIALLSGKEPPWWNIIPIGVFLLFLGCIKGFFEWLKDRAKKTKSK